MPVYRQKAAIYQGLGYLAPGRRHLRTAQGWHTLAVRNAAIRVQLGKEILYRQCCAAVQVAVVQRIDAADALARQTLVQAQTIADHTGIAESKGEAMTSRRVLIIEDEDDVRAVTRLSLEMVGGWNVLTASSGREGLLVAAAEQPEAILLDVMMPDMDGPTTLQKLQENPATQHIPVLFLTAKVQTADHNPFAALGVQGIISKPFNPMLLSTQVATTLGWSV